MHPTVIAQREAHAQRRIMAAAATVAERHGLDKPIKLEGRYTAVNAMQTWESVATFLEALATVPEPAGITPDDVRAIHMLAVAEVLAIPGLSKTSTAAIQKYYDQQKISEDQQNSDATPIPADQQSENSGA